MPVTVKVTQASPSKSDVPLRPRAKINTSAKPLRTRNDLTPRSVSPVRPRYSPSPTVRVKSKVTPPARYPPTHSRSPSTSTVSFSSRSSVSITRSPEITSTDDQLRSTLTTLLQFNTDDQDQHQDQETDDESEQQNLKAEAKSNRKIADLEITNRSLLAINASLESTKHKQSKEIRDLRRKLRESRLVLPPRAFRAVNDTDDPVSTEESDEDEDEAKDEAYMRIKAMLDNLLEVGRRALESQPKDFVEGAKKVLSADELRSWNDHDPRTLVPDSVDSEDEVERSLVHTTPSPSPIRAMYR